MSIGDVPDATTTVIEALEAIVARREGEIPVVTAESDLLEDLGLDSLERAELASMLEDRLGSDPYNEGLEPETVAELIAFYG